MRICLAVLLLACVLAGCDRGLFQPGDRAFEQAEQKRAAGDYRGAITDYERALADTTRSADIHFRMGMIYDANLNDQVGAVHHFRRYLEILPTGPHAKEAKANLDRLELALATKLAGGTLITHAEATKLRQDNNDLRAELAKWTGGAQPFVTLSTAASGAANVAAGKTAARDAELHPAPGTRTYVVQPGDTLVNIARKMYHNPNRTKDIQDANMNTVPNPKKLKAGITLIIP